MAKRRSMLFVLGGGVLAAGLLLIGGSAAQADTTPSAPTNLQVYAHTTASTAEADVSWVAPTNNGGSALTYAVTTSPATSTFTTSSTTTTVTGLTPGESYTFTVKATNGGGLWNSATSSSVEVLTPPTAPTNVTASKSGSSITVEWDEPSSAGSAGFVSGYVITPRIGGVEQTGLQYGSMSGETSHTFTGLTQGTSYTFVVRAWTGWGSWALSAPSSASSAITWYGTPSAPTNLNAFAHTTAGDAEAAVSWNAPTTTGGSSLTYEVTTSPVTSTFTTTGTTKTVTGLTPGTSYTFTVKAINAGGLHNSGTTSSVEVLTAPSAPSNVTVSKSGSSITVNWDAPTSAGSAGFLSGYVITPRIGGVEQPSLEYGSMETSTSHTFTGLARGTSYTFVVRAWSGWGTWALSAPSSASSAIAWYGTPSAPTNINAFAHTTATTAEADVTWNAPSDTGGSSLTYEITTSPPTSTFTTTGTSKTVTGLTPGASYTFTVKATNAGGLHNSATSSSVEVLTAPSAPSNVTVSKSGSSITVNWDAPTSAGSAGFLSGYVITPRIGGVEQNNLEYGSIETTTSHTFTGLAQGTSYTFVVRAWSGWGTWALSAPSSASSAIAWYGTPSAPTNVNAWAHTTATTAEADVSWNAPATTGGSSLTYEVTTSPATSTFTTTGTTKTVTGLTPGTSYTFTVKAINAGGNHNSTTSSSVDVLTAPGAPTGVTATKSGSSVTVDWTAPGSTGSAGSLTGYVITPVVNGVEQTALEYGSLETGTSHTFTGLPAGQTYTFVVRAWSGWGTWALSAPSTASNGVAL